jgi:acetyl-CoA C-acetyltransferase
MSGAAHYSRWPRWGVKAGTIELKDALSVGRVTAGGRHHEVPGGMLETAENVRREFAVSREDQDRLAVRSHEKAAAAGNARRFADELVPVMCIGGGQGLAAVFEQVN